MLISRTAITDSIVNIKHHSQATSAFAHLAIASHSLFRFGKIAQFNGAAVLRAAKVRHNLHTRERPGMDRRRLAGSAKVISRPGDPEDDFFFGRKHAQPYDWGDIAGISTQMTLVTETGSSAVRRLF